MSTSTETLPKGGTEPRGPDFSIVIPVYFNEGNLTSTMAGIRGEVLERNPGLSGEVIFVDDGSGDGSFDELLRIRAADPRTVRVIKLSRNFGQVNALAAGFAHARGRCVIAISADGQDPPALMNEMLKAHFEEGYEIVAGERSGRDESAYRIITSRIFYALMRKLSFPNLPLGGFDYVLLSRRVVNLLLKNREAHAFFQGQILWTGFRPKFIPYFRKEREVGESRWSFGRKLTYLIDGTMGYSFFPIRFISVMGVLFALLGFFYAGLIIVLKLFGGIPVTGWAPLMVMILVMGGFQMLMLGVIGEYLWRALAQVRNRDPYVIEAVHEADGPNSPGGGEGPPPGP